MSRIRALFLSASFLRALVEGWLVCAVLLVPIVPAVLEAPPLPRSLYLLLLPVICAVVVGLRRQFSSGPFWKAALNELALSLLLALSILGMVMGLVVSLGGMESIQYSYAGTNATIFFLCMAAPEYLGMRTAVWLWQEWDRLRRRRYVWALTHAILCMVWGTGLLILFGFLTYWVIRIGNDIWGIPPESTFAQGMFWLTVLLLLLFLFFIAGIILFLPPTMLFSFLVARKLTTRLENLAAATQALRKGDLATRVFVKGEDEVAQLQTDFNGMAVDLEKSVLALQAEKDKVWALMEARRELVAEVSHELRNPVAILLGYSDSLRRGWKDHTQDEVQRDLETIQYEASRMQTILNDLLASSQIEAGRLRVDLCAVDVTALARRLVETFSGLAWERKRIQVTLSAPAPSVFALADPLRLEQVLVNLVQNAMRHTSPGGLVAIEISADTESICIDVEDTGEGISSEDLPHIWEKYYQAGSPERRAQSGMGLGLSLVKELTEAMGGAVNVESWPEHGSLFQVRLPACKPLNEAE